jgi:CheY-like chemotaxis protein
LLGLNTPRMDGWEFRTQQRQDPALTTIPVAVVTGTAASLESERRLEADGYLMKPYDTAVLLPLVADYCQPRR